MRLFIDQGTEHQLTKRLLPHWTKMGVILVPLEEAQVHLSFVNFTRVSSVPKVLRLDGLYYNLSGPYRLENQPILKSYKNCQGIIFQSEYSKRFAQTEFGPLPQHFPSAVVYNGMDPTWDDPREHQNFNIVVCSNWRAWKRLSEMLEVVKPVAELHNIFVHVVGTGKGMQVKRTYPFVRWYGDIKHEQMRELYRKMDLAMHLAKRDWCPNVVLEFFAAGIPCIVSDKGGGAKELANLVCPDLVAEGDVDPDDTKPVAQYASEWNRIEPVFQTNIQSKIQIAIGEPRRVKLPYVLSAAHVAESYYNFMKEFI
jgi:glycosyltransferase involved in cell wall biosynthesis